MQTQSNKSQENDPQSVPHALALNRSKPEAPPFAGPQARSLPIIQQLADHRPQTKPAAQLQAMADAQPPRQAPPIPRAENNTGLPQQLKAGAEQLSGLSLADVKVHYNSDKPAQLQAHGYTQGAMVFTDVYLDDLEHTTLRAGIFKLKTQTSPIKASPTSTHPLQICRFVSFCHPPHQTRVGLSDVSKDNGKYGMHSSRAIGWHIY